MRQDPERFWRENDLIVASLALARNKRHRPLLSGIGFDMVIVDEAHHVKNDRTVGWKLIGAEGFIHKPFSLATLAAKLKQVLEM